MDQFLGGTSTGTKLLRVPFREARFLSERDFRTLLATIEDADFRDIVVFAVFTMMRLGEITNLRWADVDLVEKQIYVRNSSTFRVKGGRPRAVPMHAWVCRYLRQKDRRDTYVFTNHNGKKLDGRALSRRFKRYVRKAGLDDSVHFHSLRHTGISWLIEKGVPAEYIRRIAGHSSLAVTQIYTHVPDTSLVAAVDRLDPVQVDLEVEVISKSISSRSEGPDTDTISRN